MAAPDPETAQCDPSVACAYTAQAAEVTADMETGRVKDVWFDHFPLVPEEVLKGVKHGHVKHSSWINHENRIRLAGQTSVCPAGFEISLRHVEWFKFD